MIAPPALRRRAVVGARDRSSTSTCSRRPSRCSRSSNGHIGLRGNLDEGEPHGLPGTYLNSFYELRPLPYAEAGYGYPESGQTIVNVTNGKLIRLLVDDEPFDVRYGKLLAHERVLDLRAGMLRPHASSGRRRPGTAVRVRSTRLVSFAQRAVAAIDYEVEPLDGPVRVVVQSELVANEPLPAAGDDPRAAAALDAPLRRERARRPRPRARARPPHPAQRAADGGGDGPRDRGARRHRTSRRRAAPDLGRVTVDRRPRARAAAADRQVPRLRLVEPALAAGAARPGRSPRSPRRGTPAGTGCSTSSARYLDDFWDRADVELDGDAELQQAVRFALFHVLQAGARAEQRAIAGQGPDRPRLRRPHLLGHRDASCCRC